MTVRVRLHCYCLLDYVREGDTVVRGSWTGWGATPYTFWRASRRSSLRGGPRARLGVIAPVSYPSLVQR